MDQHKIIQTTYIFYRNHIIIDNEFINSGLALLCSSKEERESFSVLYLESRTVPETYLLNE